MSKHQLSNFRKFKHLDFKQLVLPKLFLIVALVLQLLTVSYPARASACKDVHFIFARGSGEPLSGPSENAWRTSLLEKVSQTKLTYHFYELGSSTWGGSKYPAVAVSGSLDAIGNLVGAYVSAGSAFEFGHSVEEGTRELKSYIRTISAACPQTKFVLGGYSQGAMLISRTLSELDSNRIIYVANFGDPKLYLPEGKGINPEACRGRNLSNYRAYVSDCRAYEGVLGSIRPYQPSGYYNKLGVWCHGKDIMCSSGFNISDHTSYVSRGLYLNAAETIQQKLHLAFPDQVTAPIQTPTTSAHDLVIFINTDGFDPVRVSKFTHEAQQLADQTREQGGRVALYVYADRGKLYPQELCDFSCNADEFERTLTLINTKYMVAGGSVDSGLSALKLSMQSLKWQVGATKSAVIFTPTKIDVVDRDGTTLDEVVKLSLSIDPVNVYSFITPGVSTNTNQLLAEATGGKVYTFAENANHSAYQEILGRPVAKLALEEYAGLVEEEFLFDASDSQVLTTSATSTQSPLRYDWDLDGDGEFELKNAPSTVRKVYHAPLEGFIQVRVTDAVGHISNMSARLKVSASQPNPPQIHTALATKISPQTYQINFQVQDTERILVVLNDAVYGYIDPSASSGFMLQDVEKPLQVRLVPYNSTFGRGEAVDVKINPLQSSSSVSSPDLSRPETTPNVPHQDSNQSYFIPKVPNTGVREII